MRKGFFVGFGTRLREERLRLKMSQPALAEACNASKRSQVNYEGEENSPGVDYFAKAAELGIDVLYVITGVRSHISLSGVSEPSPSIELTDREAEVLRAFRRIDEKGKRAIESMTRAL